MRWIRLAFISLLSFFLVTSSTFFKQSIAFLTCGMFMLNALTCSVPIDSSQVDSSQVDSSQAMAIEPSNVISEPILEASWGQPDSQIVGQIPRRRIQNRGGSPPSPTPSFQETPAAPPSTTRPSVPAPTTAPIPAPTTVQPTTGQTNAVNRQLGIDRWWATAGGDANPMPVTLTLQIHSSDDYTLNIDVEHLNQWDLNSQATIAVDQGQPIQIDGFLSDSGEVQLGRLEKGKHQLYINGFDVPRTPTIELITFKLTGATASEFSTQELEALFVADQPQINTLNMNLQALVEEYSPTLHFDTSSAQDYPEENPGTEKYWIPLDAKNTTWTIAEKDFKNGLLLPGDPTSFFRLPQGSEFFNQAIYAAVVQNPRNPRQIAINYYFHYSFSNWQDHKGYNNHEGDWEGITVFLERSGQGALVPQEVAFSQHVTFAGYGGGQKIPWREVENQVNHHPEVYVGLGGHASYPQEGCSKWPTGIEYHNGGKEVNVSQVILLPRAGNAISTGVWTINEPWAWLLYSGHWGDPRQCTNNFGSCGSAPRGPIFLDSDIANLFSSSGRGERWIDPWSWAEDFSASDKPACDHEKPTPEHTPGTGNKKKGTSYGDPHLITFDGHRYSFQTVGEFVLAKSTDGYFEVQTRQAPVSRSLSLNSAVAMRVGRDRVAFYSKDLPDSDSSTPLRVNGAPTVVSGNSLTLPGGGTIHRKGDNNYVVEWDTGEEVAISIYDRGQFRYMDVFPVVFESQANQIVGLLGNANDSPEDDLRFRSGNLLPSKSTYGNLNQLVNSIAPVRIPLGELEKLYFDQLNKDYGRSWRVSPEESLFDYAPAQTTESFIDRAFPDAYLTLDMLSPDQIQQARNACLNAGVVNDLLEGCIFDVGFTGYSEFAYRAAQVSNILDVIESVIPEFNNPIPDILRRIPHIPGLPF